MIPFVDLKAQYLSLKDEFDAAIVRVVSETAFVSGRYAAAFEESFAGYLEVNHCVAVANGTDREDRQVPGRRERGCSRRVEAQADVGDATVRR